MKTLKFALAVVIVLCFSSNLHAADRPNILIILTDDMGFSDLGCFGGEIKTPNLDKLAADGLRFTEFYNTARCWPTRATLMSGQVTESTSHAGSTSVPLVSIVGESHAFTVNLRLCG